MADNGGYRIGDVANGYVLTEHGWRPLGPGGARPAYQPAPGSGSRTGVWIVLAVVAVVLVGGIAAVGLALVNARNTIGDIASPSVTSSTTSGSGPASTTASSSSTTPAATATTSTPAASKAPGEGFAFGETATVLNQGAPAAEITVGRPVEFTSTNPYSTPAHGRFVYVPVTVKATGSVTLPVEDFHFQVLLPNGDYDSPLYIAGRPAEAAPDIDEASVKPGDTLVGSVIFDVPKDVELKIAYEPALKDLAVWS